MVDLSRTLTSTLHHCGLWTHEIQVGNIEFCRNCVLSSITFTVHIHLNGNRTSWRSFVVQNWLRLQRSFVLCFKCLTRPFESPLLFMHHSLPSICFLFRCIFKKLRTTLLALYGVSINVKCDSLNVDPFQTTALRNKQSYLCVLGSKREHLST